MFDNISVYIQTKVKQIASIGMTSSQWKQWFAMKVMVIVFLFIPMVFNPPYGYYQVMRIALMWLFFKFAMKAYEKEQHALSVICGLCVVLFQPFEKIAFKFNKSQWTIIDASVMIFMVTWCAIDVRNYLNYDY